MTFLSKSILVALAKAVLAAETNQTFVCCYSRRSCDSSSNYCAKSQARCIDCGGKFGPTPAWMEQKQHEDEREHEEHRRKHEREHKHEESGKAFARFHSCCYGDGCTSCEHLGDTCSMSHAHCKDCGGKKVCTAEEVQKAANAADTSAAATTTVAVTTVEATAMVITAAATTAAATEKAAEKPIYKSTLPALQLGAMAETNNKVFASLAGFVAGGVAMIAVTKVRDSMRTEEGSYQNLVA